MAKNGDNNGSARPVFTEADIKRARDCFAKAQQLAANKNYDYAIEWYINGLEHWPEAVDEGHKPCRAAALFRGGKKVGFSDSMKYKTGGKDTKKAMLNSEMLLSKDPRNVGFMESMFRNAGKGRFDDTTLWIGEILYDAASREPKPSADRFALLRQVYEEMGNRCADSEPGKAIIAYERAIEALSRLRALKPNDSEIGTDLRDLAGKLTIVKGKYDTADSFKDSVRDTASQREIHDKERLVQADERMDDLIAQARQRYKAAPTDGAVVNALVDLLCRREQDEEEDQAIDILQKAYEDTKNYRFRLRADDIRMKQFRRKARKVAESGDRQAAKEHLRKQLKSEIRIFQERLQQYPTDLRIKYELGVRLFQARLYDDAIPLLQEARSEPKMRFHCMLYIGRCFFEKGFNGQATDVLREAIGSYEIPDDKLGKELHYWMGRSLEADGVVEDALKTYGQLIQWEYNYRKGEVRERYEDLKRKRSA